MEEYHRSVLLREAMEALNIRDAWYLDTTIGDGGHTLEILKAGGKVLGIDVDPQALYRVQQRLEGLGIDKKRFRTVLGNFRDLKKIISQMVLRDQKFAAVLFDLGVSSLQLGRGERGFSFMLEGPLDMRMDPSLGVKALDLVNALGRKELNELFTNLGEEKYSRLVADAIISARQVKRITTTRQLAEIVERAIGKKKGRIHPATRVFQALRIAVNDELNALKEALPQALEVTGKDGRILVISFHSLEDRIVKNLFRNWQDLGFGKVLTKKPITPNMEEIQENPRSRSAKLRVFEVI